MKELTEKLIALAEQGEIVPSPELLKTKEQEVAMKKSRAMLLIVMLAVLLRCVFYYVPALKAHVSDGFAVIICAVATSLLGAILFPVKEVAEDGN